MCTVCGLELTESLRVNKYIFPVYIYMRGKERDGGKGNGKKEGELAIIEREASQK